MSNSSVKNFVGFLLIFLAISFFTGAGYFAYTRFLPIKTTMCSNPSAITVVIIDTTDPLSVYQLNVIKNKMRTLKDGLKPGEIIAIYGVPIVNKFTPDTHVEPFLKMCTPENGTNTSPLTGNPAKAKKNWDKEFSTPFDDKISQIYKATVSELSPIIETIKYVSSLEFSQYSENDIPKKLIIISDMLQNSELLSQYKTTDSFDSFSKKDSYQFARTNLSGADVTIYYLRRSNSKKQGKDHVLFWNQFITNNGGTLTSIESME